jgi:2-aminoethylphosphonate-pyruvate transaminase
MQGPRVVSLTPAVFHLSDAVNHVSRTYGENPIVPRGPRLKPLIDRVRKGIQDALGARHHEPILMTGSGSTAMAAVLGSCLAPDERLLVVRNGAYGDRIHEFATTLKQPVVDMSLPYGERPDLAKIEALAANDEVDAIAMVYGGTSTCTLNPVPEVGAIAKRYGKKLLVDGISALFVEPMDLDAWNIAAVMGSCNKGLHSHPNLTMALVRHDLMDQMATIAPRAPSLELYKLWRAQVNGSHPYTIDPMSLCQVEAALTHLADRGGVAGRHAAYRARCEVLRPGYERLGLRIARWEGMPLTVIGTALHIPEGVTYDAMAERLARDVVEGHVFEIYAAQGKLSGQLFRIFNMGDYPLDVYEIFLRALARVVPGATVGAS